MAIQNLNPWYPLIVAVVATTLHYWFSKISEARRHKKEFLEKQISHLLLPLFIQFKKMDIKTYPDEVNPNKQSFLDELFDDTEIKKILTNNLYLASPQLSYYLLEFLYNSYRLESKDGIQEYRSTYGEDTEGSWGYLDDDFVFENYQILRDIIFEEYHQKVILYNKSYIDKGKKWSFIWSTVERIKVRMGNLTKLKGSGKRKVKRKLNRT